MIKSRLQVRSVSNVAASKTALIDLPCGPRYHSLFLYHMFGGGTNTLAGACANISEIRIKSNSRVQRVASGTQLRDMNLLNGTAYDIYSTATTPNTVPVVFPVFFNEPWRETPADQDALAWATSGWLSFQVEVDLAAGTTPVLQCYAVVDDFVPPANTNPGIVKWIRTNLVPGGLSFDVTNIDRRDYLQQISLYPDSGGGITADSWGAVTLKRNAVTLHEMGFVANSALLTNSQMTPAAAGRTANIYDIVLDHDGLLSSAVPMEGARDILLTIPAGTGNTTPMSGSMTAIIQRLGPPE